MKITFPSIFFFICNRDINNIVYVYFYFKYKNIKVMISGDSEI